ncbi:MAG TPA: glycosyltransferase [Gaiellaceae bacterium]|nr:glycosyltransferase [Gaiellaceae bacterium]
MKRVAYVSHEFPRLTETFTLKEVEGLGAAGIEVEPWTLLPTGKARLVERSLPSPVVVPLLASRRLPRRALAAMRGASLARSLYRARDHVHAQFPLEASNAAFFGARAAGCTYSFSGHTYHRLDLMPEKLAAASFVVVGSDFEVELLCRRYGEGWRPKIEVRRLGVPPRPSREGFEQGLVVSLGTLGAKKGHDVLVRAVAELDGARLEVIGDGPERAALEALARELDVEDRVRFAGALEHEAALAAVARANVFALACIETPDGDHDCLPVALMDAMSLGVPCVSSNAFGIPELIADGVSGLLAPPGDVPALADRIAALLGHPDEIGHAGRETVRARYDLDTNVAALAELFRDRLR